MPSIHLNTVLFAPPPTAAILLTWKRCARAPRARAATALSLRAAAPAGRRCLYVFPSHKKDDEEACCLFLGKVKTTPPPPRARADSPFFAYGLTALLAAQRDFRARARSRAGMIGAPPNFSSSPLNQNTQRAHPCRDRQASRGTHAPRLASRRALSPGPFLQLSILCPPLSPAHKHKQQGRSYTHTLISASVATSLDMMNALRRTNCNSSRTCLPGVCLWGERCRARALAGRHSPPAARSRALRHVPLHTCIRLTIFAPIEPFVSFIFFQGPPQPLW